MADGGFSIGKFLIIAGGLLVLVGLVIVLANKFGIPFGQLPGDIHVEGEKGSFHFPIVTSIVLSIVLTILLNLFLRK